jgi:hypothetical protein
MGNFCCADERKEVSKRNVRYSSPEVFKKRLRQ